MIERQSIINAIGFSRTGDDRLLDTLYSRLAHGEEIETDLTRMDPALLVAALERRGIRTVRTPIADRILAHVDHLDETIDPANLRAWEQSGDPVSQEIAIAFVRTRMAVKHDLEALARLFDELATIPASVEDAVLGPLTKEEADDALRRRA